MATPVTTHEAYFDTVAPPWRPRLVAIQAQVESLLPEVTRCISYRMPAYRAQRVFFYFAAFKAHIGIYPPVSAPTALVRALERYRGPKGNLSFPHDEPLPLALIGRVAQALHRQAQRA